MTRFMAMLLLVWSVLPFIGHICALAQAHHTPLAANLTCGEPHEDHHHAAERADGKCGDEEPPTGSHDENTREKCCHTSIQSASVDTAAKTSPSSERGASAGPAMRYVLHGHNRVAAIAAAPDRDTGPPPIAFHILYARFLN